MTRARLATLAASAAVLSCPNPAPCGPGLTLCDGVCVDLASDNDNCHACGSFCIGDQRCQSGNCVTSCTGSMTECGRACVNLSSDGLHCGGCNAKCPAGQVCSNGTCGVSCPATQAACGGSCVDVTTDEAHCGNCTTMCGAGRTCTAGQCRQACDGGTPCDAGCATGRTECGGACVDTQSNDSHCGMCSMACGSSRFCDGGSCACGGGRTDCGGACVDTSSSAAHCGMCNMACDAGATCVTGGCQPLPIFAGALAASDGRWMYSATLGVTGAQTACEATFAGSQLCTLARLQAAPASERVMAKDPGDAGVTSFWAFDPGAANNAQCYDNASNERWASNSGPPSRGQTVSLDPSTGALGTPMTGVACSDTNWVACCFP